MDALRRSQRQTRRLEQIVQAINLLLGYDVERGVDGDSDSSDDDDDDL